MSCHRLSRVLSGVMLLLSPVLLGTACGDSHSGSGENSSSDAGAAPNKAVAANGLVAGGTVMRSPHYQLIGSMTPGVADGTVGASPHFVMRTGLVGASQ
jgi:hypothetical protein